MPPIRRVITGQKPPPSLIPHHVQSVNIGETSGTSGNRISRRISYRGSNNPNRFSSSTDKDSPEAQSSSRVPAKQPNRDEFQLLKHQQEAVDLFANPKLTARLIGDEMRVGKTPTAIAIDQRLRDQIGRAHRGNNCTLIVCPKSVISNWIDHLEWMGIPSSQVCAIDLPSKQAFKERLCWIQERKRRQDFGPYYLVCNWDAVQTIGRELRNAGPWFHIIGDEIHRIKGRDTKRTTAFKRVKAKQLTGLSGTPADNRPEDFWSVLNWLRPREFSSYWSFVDEYCTTKVSRTGFKAITGVRKKKLPELRAKIAPFYIRRMLADVADSLPDKQYRRVSVKMGARQRKQYDTFKKKWIVGTEGGDILALFDISERVRLQQMAIGYCEVDENDEVHIVDNPRSPKLDAMMELVEDKEDDGSGPFLIFAQHHDTVALAKARLEGAGYCVSTLIGTDLIDERKSAVERFQSGVTDVFVGTIGACREGITLNRANSIIFIDRAWNPSWNKQAEARADSLTAPKVVTVYVLETEDSIDQERLLRIQQKASDTTEITRI